MKPIDLTKVIKKEHELKWVALSKDNKRVVAFDKSLVALSKEVKGKDVTYMKVPQSGVYLNF
ncbi:hypothetical protein BH11PAT2_BH11PAT2_07180 [soil metagenome]